VVDFKVDNFESSANCSACTLNNTPKVFSCISNVSQVDILVIGQSPGLNEVKEGKPFVGASGELIHRVLDQYSKNTAMVNIISCRPEDQETNKDRQPSTIEVKCCRPRLDADINYIISHLPPKTILVFGAIAKKEMQRILKSNPSYEKIPIATFDHPAYILRNRHLEPRYVAQLHNHMKSIFGNSSTVSVEEKFVTYTDNLKHQFVEDAYSSKNVGVDIETNSLNVFSLSFIIGTIAVSCDKFTYFFDCREKDIKEYDVLVDFLQSDKVQKVFADILFDVVALAQYNIKVRNYSDLFPLAFIYDNTYNEYGLEAISMRYMPDLAGYKSKFKSSLVEHDYLGAPTEELKRYNAYDSYMTRMLYNYIYDRLDVKAKTIFEKITVKLLPVLVVLKCSGMKIDADLLDQYTGIFKGRIDELSKYFNDKYGVTNINSTPQISKWLFETLKLKPIKYNDLTATQKAKGQKKGSPSTDKEVLEAYANEVPDVNPLYEARRVTNVLTYFLPSIKESLDDRDIVHPNFKHYGIQSFRLACKAPPLQGIPRDETKSEFLNQYPLRRLFVARFSDSYILECDFSQQEVRIVAELARDKGMMDTFAKNEDIHKFVGSLVFEKPIDQITKFERQIAKGCVFGAIFGASAKEMSVRLHMPEKQAQTYLNKFVDAFPSVSDYLALQHRAVKKNGVIHTVLGRPRKFLIDSNSRSAIADAEREAANHCFHWDTRVLLEGGASKTIKEIVDKKLSVKVASVNSATNKIEFKRVVNWFKNEYKDPRWLRVNVQGSNGKHGAVCTPDHRYYTSRGVVEAKNLRVGDMLYTNYLHIPSTTCEQIILGSLLGDGGISMSNGVRLYMTHCNKQRSYLEYKCSILQPYIGGKVSKGVAGLKSFKPGNIMWNYRSNVHWNLAEYYNLKYPNLGVKDIVNKISWLGLAIWYQDDGGLCRSRHNVGRRSHHREGWRQFIRIHTESFSFDESILLAELLNKKFGLKLYVRKRKCHGVVVPVVEMYSKQHLKVFFDNIKMHIHPGLKYKLPTTYCNSKFDGGSGGNVARVPALVKCVGITEVCYSNDKRRGYLDACKHKTKYNIEVEDNHNYFVGGGAKYFCLVKNCIQSLGADISFLSLIKIHDKLVADGVLYNGVFIINTIHDSILFDVRRQYLKYVCDEIAPIMTDVPKMLGFKVKFPVDIKVGKRWGESLKLEDILKQEVESA